MPSPGYTREIPQRYRLEAGTCRSCGKLSFPPRRICSECGGEDFSIKPISDRGRIETFTVIHVGPDDLAVQTPYVVGIIETDDGARLTTQIVDCKPEEVEIGLPVELVFRLIRKEGSSGLLCYGYKSRLLRE